MIVLDSSAAVWALTKDGPHRRLVAEEELHAPHLLDSEVAQTLRRLVAAGRLPESDARASLDTLGRMDVTRYPAYTSLARIWQLRPDLSAYDATYVALAEALGAPLVTADAKLSRAPGIQCMVTVIPA